MGLIFNRGSSDDGCDNHHYPEEWEKTDKLDIIHAHDINIHEEFGEDDPFSVEVYRKKEKKCLHEGCGSKKRKWVKIGSAPQDVFIRHVKEDEVFIE